MDTGTEGVSTGRRVGAVLLSILGIGVSGLAGMVIGAVIANAIAPANIGLTGSEDFAGLFEGVIFGLLSGLWLGAWAIAAAVTRTRHRPRVVSARARWVKPAIVAGVPALLFGLIVVVSLRARERQEVHFSAPEERLLSLVPERIRESCHPDSGVSILPEYEDVVAGLYCPYADPTVFSLQFEYYLFDSREELDAAYDRQVRSETRGAGGPSVVGTECVTDPVAERAYERAGSSGGRMLCIAVGHIDTPEILWTDADALLMVRMFGTMDRAELLRWWMELQPAPTPSP